MLCPHCDEDFELDRKNCSDVKCGALYFECKKCHKPVVHSGMGMKYLKLANCPGCQKRL